MKNTNKQKILYLITKSNWGGAQRYVYDLATHLDKNQFEVIVACGGSGVLTEQLTHAGIRIITLNHMQNNLSPRKITSAVRECSNLLAREQPDILHTNSSVAGFVGGVAGRYRRVRKIIFTAHGWAFNEDRPWLQKIIFKFFHWLTVLFSHKTIAVSHAIIKQMNWPLSQHKMKLIHPGRTIGVMYNKQEARTKLAEICPPLHTHTHQTWVLTIAELHPIKRLTVLIDAMAKLRESAPQLRSIIIGDGQLHQTLSQQIRNLQLENHVFLTGNITEAARFLKAADLFVLPSKSESYGYVLHEAGLAHLPVIATNVGGIPDIIVNQKTGQLIEPDDIPALSATLTDFLSHRSKWHEYAHNLQEAMRSRTVEKMAEQTTALYQLPLH